MGQEAQKKAAAYAALDFVQPGMVIGVGTGSTVRYFIEGLGKIKNKLEGAVASSKQTEGLLKALSVPILDLNNVGPLELYVDGADEINPAKQMIKGGGGALTREKIIATAAKTFICIADQSKMVDLLGKFPVAVEAIPMARSLVARQIRKLDGDPEYRQSFMTDNQNIILDVHNFKILDPIALEQALNNITGIVENGIFAARPADILLLGTDQGTIQS